MSFSITPQNLDIALRYWRVLEAFSDCYSPSAEVVEVGSGAGGITEFMHHPVTGVDLSFDRTGVRGTSLLTQVQGSADALPFPDGSFDIVLCVDTMEHLRGEQRQPALMEMRRIARPGGRVVVAFPADRAGERLDRRLNAAFRRRHGIDHPWLVEHIETGLPRTAEVTADLRAVIRPGDRVRIAKHLSAPAWYLVHRLFTVHHDARMVTAPGPAARGLATAMFRMLRSLSLGPTYRRVFTIEVGGPG